MNFLRSRVSILLVICILLCVLPLSASAEEEKPLSGMESLFAGITTVEDVYGTLDPETVPDAVGYESADLDAENLFRRIHSGEDSISAYNAYYQLLSEASNRAQIFKTYLSYSVVESKVLSILEMTIDEVASSYSDTYDFLMSLNNTLSSINHY